MPHLDGHRVVTKEIKDIDQAVPIAFVVPVRNGELQKQGSHFAFACDSG
jgi:hypothetical protein